MTSSADISLPAGLTLLPGAIEIHYARSGGPGGQNVNKVNTKALLWFDPTRLTGLSDPARQRLLTLAANRLTNKGKIQLIAETHRTQEANRQAALEKLEQLILTALKTPKHRRKTRPSKASKLRRLESKRHRSELKSQRRPGD